MYKIDVMSLWLAQHKDEKVEWQLTMSSSNIINLGNVTRLTLGGTGPGVEAFAGRPGPRVTTC